MNTLSSNRRICVSSNFKDQTPTSPLEKVFLKEQIKAYATNLAKQNVERRFQRTQN